LIHALNIWVNKAFRSNYAWGKLLRKTPEPQEHRGVNRNSTKIIWREAPSLLTPLLTPPEPSGTAWSEQEWHEDYMEGGPKLTHPTPDSSGALRNSME
jgi:hypothetical protein